MKRGASYMMPSEVEQHGLNPTPPPKHVGSPSGPGSAAHTRARTASADATCGRDTCLCLATAQLKSSLTRQAALASTAHQHSCLLPDWTCQPQHSLQTASASTPPLGQESL